MMQLQRKIKVENFFKLPNKPVVEEDDTNNPTAETK
jgi:hypothetical protein